MKEKQNEITESNALCTYTLAHMNKRKTSKYLQRRGAYKSEWRL